MRPHRFYCNQLFPTLQVSSMDKSIDFYVNRLGFTIKFTWGTPVTFAGVALDKVSIHLSAYPHDPVRIGEVNFVVEDAEEMFNLHQQNKVNITVHIGDREYGLRDYEVEDPDGNRLVSVTISITRGRPSQ